MDNNVRMRGCPPGKFRAVFWICGGLVDGVFIMEQIGADKFASEQDKKDFSKEQAIENYITKYGQNPDKVLGPFYERKGVLKSLSEEDQSVDDVDDDLSDVGKQAVYRGWKGKAYEYKNRKDVVGFFPSEPIDASSKKKQMKFCNVRKDAISFVEV